MTSSILINLLLGLAVVAYLGTRQLLWRPVDPSRMWRLPLVLGAIGVVSMARAGTSVHAVDVVVLGLSAVAALISGALMGRIARLRPSATRPGLVESRTGWRGVGLWVALVAVRVALDVTGHRWGADVAVSTGSILLVIGLNRAAAALVLSARQPRHAYAAAGK